MKLIIEVEIEEGTQAMSGGRLRGSEIKSVTCNGKEIEQKVDEIGRADGYFYSLPGPKKDDCFTLDLVQWFS